METLSDEQIDELLAGELSAWRRDGAALVRDVALADFAAAIALVNDVAAAAEELDHHPDILIHGWRHVRLMLSTHSAGGLTALDAALARRLDALLR